MLRGAGWASIVSIVACSQGPPPGPVDCLPVITPPPVPAGTPAAFVHADIGPGSDSTNPCQVGTPTAWIEVGMSQALEPTGTMCNVCTAQTSRIACSVRPAGGGFSVSIDVESCGSKLQLTGNVSASASASVRAAILGLPQGTPIGFEGGACTLTVNASGGISPGRLSGTLKCEHLMVSGQPGVCSGVVDLAVENCKAS